MALWIVLGYVAVGIFMWAIVAGKQKENDDEEQARYLAEWYRTHPGKNL